ncbi:hypothetical protein BU23DRAFT_465651 [Bimuria novae-zelandiae CBS 107.79]|uniref:Integral membrane protein n=1 Tax=Bimuria novae-zelandiae CBS 107.79 TaxID=1447943 RepID=A0A6A5VB78_9PLEO|nr:hypothetical protein BU23DRAFT_465651 [Bimuria novae-zelandiae CBS 107.79]
MSNVWRPEVNIDPWGPFIGRDFKNQTTTKTDIIITCFVWAATVINSLIAIYLGYHQSKTSRSPLRSVYIWMIWLELGVSFIMGLESFLHVMKFIRPSFAFYFTILFWWCIQVQLLLQIIINRIRIIVPDRRFSRKIMIGTAVIVTAINISVFNIWIPARCQINHTYILVNEIWDRMEKVVYLLIDALLNWYFLKTVKANLINNGLQKYNKLLRFNQRIIILSLLMDVMIIAAMSIPNTFIYIQFHPLAYLVKLNIEMTMANLIKRIAISSSRKAGNHARIAEEFGSSNLSTSGAKSRVTGNVTTLIKLSNHAFDTKSSAKQADERIVSFEPTNDQIKVTKDIHIRSDPNPDYDGNEPHIGDIISNIQSASAASGLKPGETTVTVSSTSVDDLTEGGSVRSDYGPGKGDSDDEGPLVVHAKKGSWQRLGG